MTLLLILEDDAAVGQAVRLAAVRSGYEADVFCDPDQFLAEAANRPDALLLLDLCLGEADGVDVLRSLAALRCQAPIALMSGADQRVLDAARRYGAGCGLRIVSVLNKPFRADQIPVLLGVLAQSRGEKRQEQVPIHEALHRAILQGELLLHYQPKWDLKNNRLAGAEALVRWNRPGDSLVPPGRFIPVAEETGLIIPLTHWVLNAALKQLAEWRAAGLLDEVSVNIPSEMLNDPAFPRSIATLLARYEVPGSSLTLEVTESGATKDILTATDVLTRLRIKDVNLSIDDFGTGYSSLVKLCKLPFNELKIDRSFVRDFDTDADSGIVTSASITMAKSLGMRVVAEGVETQAVLDLLVRRGCDIAQGFHVGRPMAPQDFVTAVARGLCNSRAAA